MSDTDKPGGDTPPEDSTAATGSASDTSSGDTSSGNTAGAEKIDHDKGDRQSGKIVERALCMILFGFIGYFVFWAICLLALVQFIFTLINREANDDLKRFTANLAEYMRQIGAYLGYATEERPCPFGPFPNIQAD